MTSDKINVDSHRFIPFDLGGNLDDEIVTEIIYSMTARKYEIYKFSQRQEVFFTTPPWGFCINNRLMLFLFRTGMGVFVIQDKEEPYEDEMIFAARYLINKRSVHQQLLSWTHDLSSEMREVIHHIRFIIREHIRSPRTSSLPNWEQQGISYVLSISFFELTYNGSVSFDNLPESLKKGIPAILNPSYLDLDDSFVMSQHQELNETKLTEDILELEDEPEDYDSRKDVMCYMSWAGVILVGNLSEVDKEDWICLELELQHYWYYVYCMNQTLPKNEKELKKCPLSITQFLTLKIGADKIKEDLFHINDTSLPQRYYKIMEGLVLTSGISEYINRYITNLNFWEQIISAKQDEQRRLLAQSTEVLLYALAFLQIAPVL